MGGDEFLLLISDIDSVHQVETLASRILHTLNTAFQLGKYTVSTSCSLGIALCKHHEDINPSMLITRSDKALHVAKKAGKTDIHSPTMNEVKYLWLLRSRMNWFFASV